MHAVVQLREPIVDAPLRGILEEIDSAFYALDALLRAAAGQCDDYPGARRMLMDHAYLIRRTGCGYRGRLANELPQEIRHA